MLKLGLNENISNSEYHGDKEYVSSSVLKCVLDGIETYHYHYILGNPKVFGNTTALEDGSLTHSMLLEPHNTANDFAFYTGFRKQGADYDAFVLLNQGKTIIGSSQKARVDKLVEACKRDTEAMEVLKTFSPEHTVCAEIDGVKVKVRADAICVDRGIVGDVKTTSGSADLDGARAAVERYMYHMSAALYCMVFEAHYGKPFDFYWIFISKSDLESRTYKVSKDSMSEGRALVKRALKKLKAAREHNVWTEHELAKVMGEEVRVFTALDDIVEL